MIIQWYGQSCFRIESRGTTLVIDPFDKSSGLSLPRFKADIIFVTHAHPDHSFIETIGGNPFIIQGPGEYEIKGIAARGIPSYHDASQGNDKGLNTIYLIEAEDISLCHLGDFGENGLRQETLEAVGGVDILFIPVGGTYTINGKAAAEIASAIEPRIVIPMHYKIPGLAYQLRTSEPFLHEMDAKDVNAQEKLVIKKKDLEEEKTKVIVLKRA